MNSFLPFMRPAHDENTRTCWDYSFQLTPEHPTAEDFDKLKHSCDTLADDALARLNELAPPPEWQRRRTEGKDAELRRRPSPPKESDATATARADASATSTTGSTTSTSIDHYSAVPSAEENPGDPFAARTSSEDAFASKSNPGDPSADPVAAPPKRRDLYALVKQHAATDPAIGALWEHVTAVPEWVDWDQIARGQDVFYRYGGPCLTGLAFQSLIGGLGATRVVETLTRTGGFSTPVVRHRLYETTQHVLQVTASPESLKPDGAGFASSVRVRLLHAAVRTRIRSLAAADPAYFDLTAWGIPISDLDAAATIGTFSATLVWLALPRQGILPTAQEEVDYIALWRYVGYLVGAPDAPFADVHVARRFMESLLLREIDPSPTSRTLAANTLAGLAHSPPQRASPAFLHALTHWLNGHALADALGVPRPPWRYTLLVAGQSLGFMALCYGHRAVPWLDRRKVATLRRVFWQVIVEGRFGLGEEARFEFKYIPQLGKTTTRREKDRIQGAGVWGGEGGVERRSIVNLVVAVGMVAWGAWAGWQVVGRWA